MIRRKGRDPSDEAIAEAAEVAFGELLPMCDNPERHTSRNCSCPNFDVIESVVRGAARELFRR